MNKTLSMIVGSFMIPLSGGRKSQTRQSMDV
jgi:hypothetical protein